METMAVQKSWFAVLNDQDIVEEVLQMPSSVSGAEFIVIPAEDQSLVGKRYNRETGEFETAVYYYAELDEKGIVVEIISSPTPETKDNWIQIPSDDKTLTGKWYDKENKQFIDPPAYVIAAHSTDEICYKQEDKWLSKKLDEMEQVIAEVEKQEGPKGEQGDIGPVGPQGAKGDTGAQGLKGDAGAQGPQGLKGDKGDAGAVGPQGAKGATGATGAQGPKGDTGASGATAAVVSKTANGLCPKTSGNAAQYLNGVGTYTAPPDTKYTHPATHPASMITGLPTSLPANGGNASTANYANSAGAVAWANVSGKPSGFGSNVAVLTGNFNAGYSASFTAPLPSGYTEAQCKFLINGSCVARTITRNSNPNQNPGEFVGVYLVIGVK